jgi:hypothetical protein
VIGFGEVGLAGNGRNPASGTYALLCWSSTYW